MGLNLCVDKRKDDKKIEADNNKILCSDCCMKVVECDEEELK